MKYFTYLNKNENMIITISIKDIKIYNKKYSLFIQMITNLNINERVLYLLKSKNLKDRLKGMNLSRNYIKMVVI